MHRWRTKVVPGVDPKTVWRQVVTGDINIRSLAPWSIDTLGTLYTNNHDVRRKHVATCISRPTDVLAVEILPVEKVVSDPNRATGNLANVLRNEGEVV